MSPLPPRLDNLLGNAPIGPNCWNATQMFHNNRMKMRFTSCREMHFWLKRNTEKVNTLRPKDILVFRNKKGNLLHTAVALTPRTYFHKFGTRGRYEIVSRIRMVIAYGDHWTIHRMKAGKLQ